MIPVVISLPAFCKGLFWILLRIPRAAVCYLRPWALKSNRSEFSWADFLGSPRLTTKYLRNVELLLFYHHHLHCHFWAQPNLALAPRQKMPWGTSQTVSWLFTGQNLDFLRSGEAINNYTSSGCCEVKLWRSGDRICLASSRYSQTSCLFCFHFTFLPPSLQWLLLGLEFWLGLMHCFINFPG